MKYSFVLSGGGAKAFCQIGAIAELELANVKPSYISGTSMGAVNAILLSVGYTSTEIYKFYEQYSVFDLFPLKITKDGIMTNTGIGEKVFEICKKLGYENLEDLPIPVCVCATDELTGKPVFLTKGNIKEAIMATTATIYCKKHEVTDEEIKKQVCEQTGQQYAEGMKIVLKDGCYTANVPFEGLDKIKPIDTNTFDICFDVIPTMAYGLLPSLNKFNKDNLENDQKRKKIFNENYNGIYLEFDNKLSQSSFNKKALENGYQLGKNIVLSKYLSLIPHNEYIYQMKKENSQNIKSSSFNNYKLEHILEN